MLNPYIKIQTEEGYRFETKNGITYAIRIADYSSMFGLPTPEAPNCRIIFLVIQPIDPPDVIPFDYQVGHTLIDFFISYFEQSLEDIVLYVCSAIDNDEEKRNAIFNRWFNYPERPNYIVKSEKIIGGDNHHFIYRNDKEVVLKIINEIDTYLSM